MSSFKRWFSRIGNSTDDKSVSNDINKKLSNLSKAQRMTVNILLLGAGGSGKSTVLKQMDNIYNANKYNNDDTALSDTLQDVHKNIMMDIYDLCKEYYAMKQKEISLKFDSSELENLAISIATENDALHAPQLTPEIAKGIKLLWDTETMKKVYDVRKKSHIMDNTPYFFEKVEQLIDPNYVVTFEDFLRIRDRTTGIINKEFVVSQGKHNWVFKMTDVGGQRAERRKWINVFDGIDVVIYVMSLSAYDQVLFEDHNTRCYDETFNLFSNTVHNKAFKETDFFVFLNKADIFEKKIKDVPFTKYKSDFNPQYANDAENVIGWVRQQYVERFYGDTEIIINNANKKENDDEKQQQQLQKVPSQSVSVNVKQNKGRSLHFHVTCATDTDQMGTVVRYVQIDLIQQMLQRAALL